MIIYDETGKCITIVKNLKEEFLASTFVGLDHGTYFVNIVPAHIGPFSYGDVINYRFSFDKKEGYTIIKMLGKNTSPDSLRLSGAAKDFYVLSGDTFVTPYSGKYYIRIYNYLDGQYKYTVKVEKIPTKNFSLKYTIASVILYHPLIQKINI